MRPLASCPRTGRLASLGILALMLAAPACAFQAADRDAAAEALLEGRYDDAIAGFERLTSADPTAVAAQRGLVRALMEVGRYEDAEAAARAAVRPEAAGAELANSLGIALRARGRTEEAEAAFRRAVDAGASDRLDARLNLGIVLYERGDRAEAERLFDSFIDVYNGGGATTPTALTAVATAVRYLGAHDPQLFRDAVRAYDEAIAAGPATHEPRLRLGELFLDKYNSAEAQATFEDVLGTNPSQPRALLGMARARIFDGAPGAGELIAEALETNPNLVPARALLARLHLDLEDYDAAEREAQRALDVDPTAREPLAVLAAVRHLRGDRNGRAALDRRALELDPRNADYFATLAELAARHRRYADAVDLAARGVELDSASWRAWTALGLNRLRTGRIEAGRAALETAFAGDPYHVWVKNTLDLLDTFEQYEVRGTERFQLFLHGDEADLLYPYVAAVAEEAYDRLSERYGYSPDTPVRVELFPNHADFSVRTVGLAGVGALGVSFGNVLALGSPAARDPGHFNWGSTLWHEIGHAVTLGMTGHRVPRWLSEGLSVLEERRARPGWGADVNVGFLLAYREGRLLPVEELNDGFVRPSYPQQIAHAYYQASLVVERIEAEYGFDAILAMLEAYGDGLETAAVFRRALGVEPAEFDAAFDDYLRERFGDRLHAIRRVAAGPDGAAAIEEAGGGMLVEVVPDDDFRALLAAGRALLDAGELDEARERLEAAAALFPEYAGADGPYPALAELYERQDDPAAAADAWAALARNDETAYEARLELARLREEMGDAAGAAAALEETLYIYPYEIDLHERLADLLAGLGEHEREVRERRAVLALEPVDRAGALYRLARAQFDAGDAAGARTDLLRALEIAPNFREAQELLLEMRAGTGGVDAR